MNRYINRDLKLVVEWIRANKLSLNTSKTELYTQIQAQKNY